MIIKTLKSYDNQEVQENQDKRIKKIKQNKKIWQNQYNLKKITNMHS